jgi:hypothetical protein
MEFYLPIIYQFTVITVYDKERELLPYLTLPRTMSCIAWLANSNFIDTALWYWILQSLQYIPLFNVTMTVNSCDLLPVNPGTFSSLAVEDYITPC